ncbi:MAG TPA: S-layer homology domain-containing protein [Candidatus Limnocylindrales bacterium]|nr:S-layer homology domain-containing protein [Candidatus Limnocylindrales bacterium]
MRSSLPLHRRPLLAVALACAFVAGIVAVPPSLGAVPPFSDTAGHPFEAHIEWLRQAEITTGCGGGRFCPDDLVTRDEMASFLVRAFELAPSATNAFTDDEGSTHEAAINSLAASGTTGGCAAGLYCPRQVVTRGQMASFLARALDLPGATRDYFADDDRSARQTDINRLAESGITSGCSQGRFCPEAGITRGQMAAFLHRALTAAGPPAACTLFPTTNVWNRRVDALPAASGSSTLISTIGADEDLHPDFGEYLGYGIPYNVVGSSTPRISVSFDYDDESDAGPYPIPPSPRTEGGGDRHILLWDIDACRLYELFATERIGSAWHAGSGAIWDLRSNALRPDGWTSADAAGLPILPGLVRYEEVAAGVIEHAIRFTAPVTRSAHLYPARHHAGAGSSTALPAMGTRVRLKADFDMTDYSPRMQVILVAMQRYGMILADNGSPWFFSGVSDVRWDDDELNELKALRGSDFEVVNTTGFVNGP